MDDERRMWAIRRELLGRIVYLGKLAGIEGWVEAIEDGEHEVRSWKSRKRAECELVDALARMRVLYPSDYPAMKAEIESGRLKVVRVSQWRRECRERMRQGFSGITLIVDATRKGDRAAPERN